MMKLLNIYNVHDADLWMESPVPKQLRLESDEAARKHAETLWEALSYLSLEELAEYAWEMEAARPSNRKDRKKEKPELVCSASPHGAVDENYVVSITTHRRRDLRRYASYSNF